MYFLKQGFNFKIYPDHFINWVGDIKNHGEMICKIKFLRKQLPQCVSGAIDEILEVLSGFRTFMSGSQVTADFGSNF